MRRKLAAGGFAVEKIGQFAFFTRTAEAEFYLLRCNQAARAGKADERRVYQALRDIVRHTAAVGGYGGEGGGVVVQNHAGVQRQRVGSHNAAQFLVGTQKVGARAVAAVEAQVGQIAQRFPFAVEIGGTAETAAQYRDFARFVIAAFVNFHLFALNRRGEEVRRFAAEADADAAFHNVVPQQAAQGVVVVGRGEGEDEAWHRGRLKKHWTA